MRWDWWKLLIPVLFWWGRTSDSGNCILNEVISHYCDKNKSWPEILRANVSSLSRLPYQQAFPAHCRSNASQPDRATPVLELTLVEYTFGHKTTNQLSEKGKIQFGELLGPLQLPVASFSDVLPPGSIVYLRHCLQLWVTRGKTVANFSSGTFCVKHERGVCDGRDALCDVCDTRLYWSILRISFVVTDQLHR